MIEPLILGIPEDDTAIVLAPDGNAWCDITVAEDIQIDRDDALTIASWLSAWANGAAPQQRGDVMPPYTVLGTPIVGRPWPDTDIETVKVSPDT